MEGVRHSANFKGGKKMRGADKIYCSTILTLKQEGKKEGSSTAEGSPKIEKKKTGLDSILETKVRQIHGISCLGH